jgi:hypothetical protein
MTTLQTRSAQDNPVIELLLESKNKDLGEFTVRRTLPTRVRQRVGPFIFFDHMGPAKFEPGNGVNVRPHPHIGLSTLTYLFDGVILHRDSLGFVQAIEPGAVNWMTAGRGIVHSERTPPELIERGSSLHGLQVWLALPEALEEMEPTFVHYPARDIPCVDRPGVHARLVAGSAFGLQSPVVTTSETLFVAAALGADAELDVPTETQERAVYAVAGEIEIGGRRFSTGSMAVLRPGVDAAVIARSPAQIVILGGATLPGERHLYWNLVNSSKARIEQAKDDWRNGRFAKVPGDDEFIPLPD